MHLNARLAISIVSVLILSIVPIPNTIAEFRPTWVLLLMFYLQFIRTEYFSVVLVFLIGLCLDVLLSTVLGEHAFALLLTAWIASDKARRFKFFQIGHQLILILFFSIVYQLLIFGMEIILGYDYLFKTSLSIALVNVMIWPLFYVLMNKWFKSQHLAIK